MRNRFVQNKHLRALIALIFTISTFVGVPLVLFATLVLLLLRSAVTLYIKCFKSKAYGSLTTGFDSIMATDNPYKDPTIIVSLYSFFKGHVSRERIIEKLKTVHGDMENRGIFPQFRQRLTTVLGFTVWKYVKSDRIEDHVFELDPGLIGGYEFGKKLVTKENAANIAAKLTKIPFPEKTSPWSYHVCHETEYPGVEGPVTFFILRFHHSMGDALAMTKYFGKLLGGKDLVGKLMTKFAKSAVPKKRNPFQLFCYILTYPVIGFFELYKHFANTFDVNPWHRVNGKARKEILYTPVVDLPLQAVKVVREAQGGVKFFSVLLAALTAGIRKYMKKTGVQVPEMMHCVVSVPIPNKEEKLSNNVINVNYRMQTGWNDRVDILKDIDEQSRTLKDSRPPIVLLLVYNLMGLLPRKLIFTYWPFTTCACTNFPGPDETLYIEEFEMLDLKGVSSISGEVGVYFWCCGYRDDAYVTIGFSTDIMSSIEEAQECATCIREELEAFKDPSKRIIVAENPANGFQIEKPLLISLNSAQKIV